MTGLQFFNNIQVVSNRGRKIKLRRISHEPVAGTPRHICRFYFAQNDENFTCLCSTLTKHNLAKKLDPTLKPSRLKEISYVSYSFLRTMVQISTPLLRGRPEILHNILHAHPEA